MQILKAEQGTQEWLDARLGRPSASQFHKLIKSNGKPSASASDYINTMVVERISGMSTPVFVTDWMTRGNELEPDARNLYSLITDNEVEEVGFILDDSGEFGCSPDGLVSENGKPVGGLEIKCPAPGNHKTWSKKKVCPTKHYAQVQGCMWICQRDWWDFMSYHPDMDAFIVRVERNQEFIDKLAEEVDKAVTEIISETRNLL
jgi:hypothetical protein